MIWEIITNKLVVSAFCASCAAQVLKSLIHLRKTGTYDWRWLFRDAGMPSAHTATVTALTLAVFFEEGFSSLFFVTAIMASIVVRDVIGDKIFAEKTETHLNEIFKHMQEFFAGKQVEWKHFIGHTIREVVAGFFVGLIVALAVQNLLI